MDLLPFNPLTQETKNNNHHLNKFSAILPFKQGLFLAPVISGLLVEFTKPNMSQESVQLVYSM